MVTMHASTAVLETNRKRQKHLVLKIVRLVLEVVCLVFSKYEKYEESNLKSIIKLKEVKNYEDQKFIKK